MIEQPTGYPATKANISKNLGPFEVKNFDCGRSSKCKSSLPVDLVGATAPRTAWHARLDHALAVIEKMSLSFWLNPVNVYVFVRDFYYEKLKVAGMCDMSCTC